MSLDLNLSHAVGPLSLVWPSPRSPVDTLQFDTAKAWRAFIDSLSLPGHLPDVVQQKFRRAQALYRLGWINPDLIKAGELAALIALELALKDRCGTRHPARRPTFADLLTFIVEVDGLTDADLPVIARCGGSAVGQLTGAVRPRLSDLRNEMAHGDPFEGPPTGGLLEVVRDVIVYAYRDFPALEDAMGLRSRSGSDVSDQLSG